MAGDETQQQDLDSVRELIAGARIVLFDFDGVIADTEVHQRAAYTQLVAELGGVLDPNTFDRYMGRSEPEIYELLGRDLALEIDVEASTARRRSLFLDGVRSANLKPFPIVAQLLREIRDVGTPAHVVSSNVSNVIDPLLQKWELRALLADIYCADDALVGSSKLDFLVRLPSRLGVVAKHFLLFEDSARVIEFARAQGMRTVGVHHSLNTATWLGADVEIDPRRC